MVGAPILLVVALAFDGQAVAPPAPPVRGSLAQMSWLVGDWSGTQGRAAIEERWTPPGGGAMLAVARTIVGDRLTAFEFLRIVERDHGLVYIAQPNGQPPTEFVLTALDADSATFENAAHDFPKMIRYTRKSDDRLEARVSGAGGDKARTFVFTRQPGAAPGRNGGGEKLRNP